MLQNEHNSAEVQWVFRKPAEKRQYDGQNTNLLFQEVSEVREVCTDDNGGDVSSPHRQMTIWHLPVSCASRTSPTYR